jgi:hypothetical protein
MAKEKPKWRNDATDMAQIAQFMRSNPNLLPRITLVDVVSACVRMCLLLLLQTCHAALTSCTCL